MMKALIVAVSVLAAAQAVAAASGPGEGLVIILAGPPGSGKTTQAEFLKKEYGIPFLSAAEVFRKSHGKKSRVSKGLAAQTASGELLSDDSLNDLMIEHIKKSDHKKGFILDGYPATPSQAAFLIDNVRGMGLQPPVIILLDVPDDLLRTRMSKRGRADDSRANIDRRIAEYRAEVDAMREYYDRFRVIRIDGTQSPERISAEIKRSLTTAGR
jgi:adenylate kinase